MKLARYDKYKDSGVPWLGKIPEHWQAMRNIGLFDERKEVNQPQMELLSVTINRGVIKQSEITTKKDSSNEDKSKYKVVRKNDLAYNKMRMWQGAIGASKYDGIVSPAYIILKPRNITYSKYYHYLYRTKTFIKESNRNSYGLCDDMNSLRYEDFKTIYSPVPPQNEVEKIVSFLDDQIAEIDKAIAKKQRLIELLKEQKAILINNAVTKGINPDVATKDSGVPWIGEIPEHWEAKKVKAVLANLDNRRIPLSGEVRGKMTSRVYDYYGASGAIDKVEDYLFDEALILIGEDGANLVMRNLQLAFIARGKYWVNNHAHILRPKNGDINYFCNALECVDYNPFITGAAQPKLTKDALKNIYLPVPPDEEQKEIGKHIELIVQEFANATDHSHNEIDKLKEYKQILISEVVTGKVKV